MPELVSLLKSAYSIADGGISPCKRRFSALLLFFIAALATVPASLDAQSSRKSQQNSKKQYAKADRASPVGARARQDLNEIEFRDDSYQPDSGGRARLSGQVYPLPALESVVTLRRADGTYQLAKAPSFKNEFLDRRVAQNQNGDFVFFTLDKNLQEYAEKLVKDNRAPHVAVIAIDPASGRILALAEKSSTISDLALHAGFPAASLFKVVTTAAAIDSGRVSPHSSVRFRGGTYELSEWNYLPNSKTDKRSMSLGEALGKSCNPVFGRVALNSLNAKMLERYARSFGFDSQVPFDLDLPPSSMEIPASAYALSRTAAGFGDVHISPLHAATLMAGLVNGGMAKRPILIDKIISPSGEIKFKAEQEDWLRLVPPTTAHNLVNLMINTTTVGTSRKEFFYKKKSLLGKVRVAGKTGTLRGNNPPGLNNWFIGAPVDNPKVAVAAIVVDPGGISTKASRMGRLMIQKYLDL